ncbi:MAG: hypothetical protein LBS48_05235 [Treponema sp.]|jgi:hypothetical protein|nr:hypothetical protein [Treponema sp.]
MKKSLLLLLMSGSLGFLFSLDMEIEGGLGNMAFHAGQESLTAGAKAFDPQLYPSFRIGVSGELKDYFSFSGGFERDPLLRNRLYASLGINLDYVSMEIGPVMGLFNAREQPVNPGFSAALDAEVPGIFFMHLQGSSSLGSVLDIEGNYNQKTGDVAAGFWVPYVVCSLNLSSRAFTVQEKADLLTGDSLTRYFFRAEVYTKNVPYTVRVDLGYQNLKRSYSVDVINGTNIEKTRAADEFKSIFLGLEGTYTVFPGFKVLLGGEAPVYAWSVRPMKDPGKGSVLFRAYAGAAWSINAE